MIIFTDLSLTNDIQTRIRMLMAIKPSRVIFRDKNLTDEAYMEMAVKLQAICRANDVNFFVDNRAEFCMEIGCKNLHLSAKAFPSLRVPLDAFDRISIAAHNREELEIAKHDRIDSVVVGHIFDTACKAGLEPKGTGIIKLARNMLNVPVFAIGGITSENLKLVKEAGADDFCIMSSAMTQDLTELEKFDSDGIFSSSIL